MTRPIAKSRGELLDRLLTTPDLPKIIPRLRPETLRRAIMARGLEDAADFVALATPAQLSRILDVDVWHGAPGGDEGFDEDRFGVWLDVLMQTGAATAATKVLGLDIELIVLGLSRLVAVFDHVAVAPFTTSDGDELAGRKSKVPTATIGAYVIEARRPGTWDSIIELLIYLDAQHPEYFHGLMHRCVVLSDGAREADGLHALMGEREQNLLDLGAARDERREERGFVTPAEARGFLSAARSASPSGARAKPARGAAVDDVRGALELHRGPLALIRAHVASHPESGEQLAHLANVLVSGASIQGRAFTAPEAADAAAAVCNLGMEETARAGGASGDLGSAFGVGWALLYRDAAMYTAKGLLGTLAGVHCVDRDVHKDLQALRRELKRVVADGKPWRARNAMEVIMMLDAPCWAALVALTDECPTLHAAIHPTRGADRIDPAAYELISQRSQFAVVREFVESLASRLTVS